MDTKTKRRSLLAAPLLATAALAMTVPFNMGGCADLTTQIGQAVGGDKGAAIGGALGKGAEAGDLSEKDELAMGESVAMKITTVHPLVTNRKLNEYVTLIGLTLANASSRPDGNWVFGVVDAPEANAFSGPDGFVMLTRGLIGQLHDESELAGVIAHEMSHVLDKHGLKAARQAGMIAAGVSALGADKNLAQFSQGADNLADIVLKKGFGREQEEQADGDAVKLLVMTGYDPHGYLNFIERTAKAQGAGGSSLMSTHPGAADRAVKIRQKIETSKNLKQGAAVLRDRFESMTK